MLSSGDVISRAALVGGAVECAGGFRPSALFPGLEFLVHLTLLLVLTFLTLLFSESFFVRALLPSWMASVCVFSW